MHTLLSKIAGILIAPILFAFGIAGYNIEKTNVNDITKTDNTGLIVGGFNPSGGGTYRLGTSIGSTDTSIKLSSFKEPVSNNPYTMAMLNTDIGYGTLDPQTTKSEFISFTGITQNSDGSANLTGVQRGLAKSYPYTASSTFRLPHAGQSIFILSDAPGLFNEYVTKRNTETISGSKTFTSTTTFSSSTQGITPILSSEIATKGYVDGVAIAGAPTMTTTVRGIAKLSVVAASTTNPIVVGDNDTRVSPVSLAALTSGEVAALVGSFGTPTTTNRYLTELDATSTVASSSRLVRYTSTGQITATTTPVATTDATSKSYVDGDRWISSISTTTTTIAIPTGAYIAYINAGTPSTLSSFLNPHASTTAVCATGDGTANPKGWSGVWNAAPTSTIVISNGCSAAGVGTITISFYK